MIIVLAQVRRWSSYPGVLSTLCGVSDQAAGRADTGMLSLDELLSVMDRAAANLERLQAVWERARPMLPTGPAGGSTPEYDDLTRAWDDLLRGLPKIDGWTITEPLPGMHDIGMMYLEYAEFWEPPIGAMEAAEAPGKALAEYRHRLNRARRQAVRDRMQEISHESRHLPAADVGGRSA